MKLSGAVLIKRHLARRGGKEERPEVSSKQGEKGKALANFYLRQMRRNVRERGRKKGDPGLLSRRVENAKTAIRGCLRDRRGGGSEGKYRIRRGLRGGGRGKLR